MRVLFIVIILSFCSCSSAEYLKPDIDLSEALSVYICSNCIKYPRDILNQYFSNDIVNEIRQKYIPYEEFNRFQTFIEMDSPSIEIINISDIKNNTYKVEVMYGEVIFKYIVILDNKLIINIKELSSNVL